MIDYMKKAGAKPIILISYAILWISFVTDIHINFVLGGFILLAIFYYYRMIEIDTGDVLLFFGTFFWRLFCHYGPFDAIFYSVGFTIIYQLGKNITIVDNDDPIDPSAKATIIIALLFLIKGLMNYYNLSTYSHGVINEEWPDWNGKITGRTSKDHFFILLAGLLAYFLIILVYKKNRLAILGIILSCLSPTVSLISRGRIIVVSGICVSLIVLFMLSIERKLYRKRYFHISILILLLSILMAFIAFNLNLFGSYDWYLSSRWPEDGGIFHNSRFRMWGESIDLLKKFPFGQGNILYREGGINAYAHNSWLDIGRQGGIIPLVLLIGFSVTNLYSMVKVWLRNDNINKYAPISGFIGAMTINIIDPIPWDELLFWSVLIYFAGILRGIYNYTCNPKRYILDLFWKIKCSL